MDAGHDAAVLAQHANARAVVVVAEDDQHLVRVVALVAVDAQVGRRAKLRDQAKAVREAEGLVRCLAVAELACLGRELIVHVTNQHHGVPKVLLLQPAPE